MHVSMGSGIEGTKPTRGVFALEFGRIVPTHGKGRGLMRNPRSRLVRHRVDVLAD